MNTEGYLYVTMDKVLKNYGEVRWVVTSRATHGHIPANRTYLPMNVTSDNASYSCEWNSVTIMTLGRRSHGKTGLGACTYSIDFS